MPDNQIQLPQQGHTKEQVLAQMDTWREDDLKWQDGRVFSLVFFAGEETSELLKEAYTMFFSENGLNPTAFPSLRHFETEVIGMSTTLLGGDSEATGNMTSGGTESILMAVITAREWAKANKPDITEPEMILPFSAHPAFEKAAHYFGVKAVRSPVGPDWQADVEAVQTAVTPKTILIVGSAPSYPHGVVDPITELAAIAQERDILCHVDACVGGFMLPFVRELGYPVPDFDFQVPGVTSISADLHKYGYAAKGASVILYRNKSIRRHQLFVYTDWSGGIYASPAMAGTRPGGTIAAAWAIMNYLGEDGYLRLAKRVMETAVRIRQTINNMTGIHIIGDPPMSLMALASDNLNIYEVGDEMGQRGWQLDRQQFPPSLHLTLNYAHVDQVDEFLMDLADSVQAAKRFSLRKISDNLMLGAARRATQMLPENVVSRLTASTTNMMGVGGSGLPQRSAAMYGMMGSLPNRGDLKEVVLDLVEQFTEPQEEDFNAETW